MRRFHVRAAGPTAEGLPEDPVIRQYRYLLRQAPSDAVEAAHADALVRLSDQERHAVLTAVQVGLVAGQRLSGADTAQLAHLIVLGERRIPNAFMTSCDSDALTRLAAGVVHSDACFGLFGGYAAWDGQDPEPEDQSAWADAGFDPDSGRWNPARRGHVDNSGLGWNAGGGIPDGGGGG